MLSYLRVSDLGKGSDATSSPGSSDPAHIASAQLRSYSLSTRIMASAEDRYRTLLDMSSTLADQPTVKAMVHTLRGLLSSTCSVHGAHLYILDSEGDSLYLFEFDQAPDAPLVKTGIKIPRSGAPARVLDEQKPVFLPDLSQEMLKIPELAHLCTRKCRTNHLFVSSIDVPATVRIFCGD